jgi:hypothetical protein
MKLGEESRWWRWPWESSGPLPQNPPQLSLVPPRDPSEESLEDVAAAGRKKVVSPCVLVEDPASPASPDSHAGLYEGEEGAAVPATILVSGELRDDGDWPF